MAFGPCEIVIRPRDCEEGFESFLVETTVGEVGAVVGELTWDEDVGGCCYEACERAI